MESVRTTVFPYRHWVLTVNLIFSSTPAEKRFQKLIEITLLLRDKQNPCPSKIMLWYYEVLNVSYRTPKPRRQCAVSRSTQGKLKKQKQGSFQCNLFLLNTLTCNIDCIFFSLRIVNLLITFISPSEKESGTAGVKCAGGAVTVTGAPDWTGWCCVNIWTCGYGRTTTGSCFSSRGCIEPPGPMCSLGATSESRLDSSLTSEKKKKGTLRKKVKKVNKFTLVTHQVRDVMSETV